MSRIYLLDDHAIVRDVLRVVLEAAGHHVVGEAAGPTPALAELARLGPEIVIVDLRLGQRSEFELLAEIQQRELPVRVIVLTMSEQPRHVAEALHLSPKTVDTYRSRLMAKLGLADVAGVVRWAIREGLIDAHDN